MRRFITCCALAALLAAGSPAFADGHERDTLIGTNLAAPLFGVYSATFQQLVRNDLSIFVRPVFYYPSWSLLWQGDRALVPEGWSYWELYADIGANYYPQNNAPEGFFAGLGLAPGYLYLMNDRDKEAPGFRLGIVTQIGYQFMLGPVAVAPRGSMTYRMPFADLDRVGGSEVQVPLRNHNIERVVRGFQLDFGLDLAIAF